MKKISLVLVLLLAACTLPLLITSCGDIGTSPLGATVGGAQDIGYARNLIEEGEIPPAEYIVPEGLFAEHDIATPEKECSDPLCLSLGYAYAPGVDDESHDLFLHLGLTSAITRDQFQRPDLDLVLVIDRSGSMSGGSLDAVKDALRTLLPRLTVRDRVMLVQFDDESETVVSLRSMDQAGRTALEKGIDRLETRGGTNIEDGIKRGYEALDPLSQQEGRSRRVMLFTDAMPNVGETGGDGFRGITSHYADRGIGMTAFGVGLNFGQELIYHISRLRGGNFFYLQNEERIRAIFNEEFDLLVTPIVYDLEVTIPAPPGATLKAIYGLPDQDPGTNEVTLKIPTVFFSNNRGAIILRYSYETEGDYAIESGEEIGEGRIRFVGTDQKSIDRTEKITHAAASIRTPENYFSATGTRLGVALTNVYLGLHNACELYHAEKKAEATAILDRAIDYATAENVVLASRTLGEEIALMEKLRENIAAN